MQHNKNECWCGLNHRPGYNTQSSPGESMTAYDKAQELVLAGTDRDDVEMFLIKNYPDLNAQGMIPTILRRAYRDLAEI